jgi:hypothetical protein
MKDLKQPQDHRCGRLLNGGIPCDLTKLPRCQAKSKTSGTRCKQPAMKGKRVCRFHGGMSPGAPKGNKHAWKHGLYTAEALSQSKRVRDLINEARRTLGEMNEIG